MGICDVGGQGNEESVEETGGAASGVGREPRVSETRE